MKRGDLVKLVLPHPAEAVDPSVPVVWELDGWDMICFHTPPGKLTRFPEGTAAVFLSPADDECVIGLLDTRILVEGRAGWTSSRYLEVIDEAG